MVLKVRNRTGCHANCNPVVAEITRPPAAVRLISIPTNRNRVTGKKPMNPWIVAGINLLAWPGIGTYVGGHKVSGAIQAAMALIGGVLSLALIVVLFRLAMKLDSTHFDLESFMEANGMLFGLGGGGLGLLAFAWVWAAVSSFLIANESKTSN